MENQVGYNMCLERDVLRMNLKLLVQKVGIEIEKVWLLKKIFGLQKM